MWSIGCLLFAWYYGYSPFECEFNDNGSLRVVECSHVRVLSKIPKPSTKTAEDRVIIQFTESVLIHDIADRPFTQDIINKTDEYLFIKDFNISENGIV